MSRKIALAVLVILISGALVWNFQEAVLDFMEPGRDAALDPARRNATRAPSVKKTLYFAGSEEDLLVPYPVEVEIGKDNVDTLHNLYCPPSSRDPRGRGMRRSSPRAPSCAPRFRGPMQSPTSISTRPSGTRTRAAHGRS